MESFIRPLQAFKIFTMVLGIFVIIIALTLFFASAYIRTQNESISQWLSTASGTETTVSTLEFGMDDFLPHVVLFDVEILADESRLQFRELRITPNFIRSLFDLKLRIKSVNASGFEILVPLNDLFSQDKEGKKRQPTGENFQVINALRTFRHSIKEADINIEDSFIKLVSAENNSPLLGIPFSAQLFEDKNNVFVGTFQLDPISGVNRGAEVKIHIADSSDQAIEETIQFGLDIPLLTVDDLHLNRSVGAPGFGAKVFNTSSKGPSDESMAEEIINLVAGNNNKLLDSSQLDLLKQYRANLAIERLFIGGSYTNNGVELSDASGFVRHFAIENTFSITKLNKLEFYYHTSELIVDASQGISYSNDKKSKDVDAKTINFFGIVKAYLKEGRFTRVVVDNANLESSFLNGQINASIDNLEGGAPIIKMVIGDAIGELRSVFELFPKNYLEGAFFTWALESINHCYFENLKLVIEGEINKLFESTVPDFTLLTDINDLSLIPVNGWPAIDKISGDLALSDYNLGFNIDHGIGYGGRITKARGLFKDILNDDSRLEISGGIASTSEQLLSFARANWRGSEEVSAVEDLFVQGKTIIDLDLSIPMVEDKKTAVNGAVTVVNNRFSWRDITPEPIRNINGTIKFNRGSVLDSTVKGLYMGEDIELKLSTPKQRAFQLDIVANLDATAIDKHTETILNTVLLAKDNSEPSKDSFINGLSQFKAKIFLPFDKSELPFLMLTSNLDGLSFNVPYPFAKNRSKNGVFELRFPLDLEQDSDFEFKLLGATGKFVLSQNEVSDEIEVVRGVVNINDQQLNLPENKEVLINANLAKFEVDRWINTIVTFEEIDVLDDGLFDLPLRANLATKDILFGSAKLGEGNIAITSDKVSNIYVKSKRTQANVYIPEGEQPIKIDIDEIDFNSTSELGEHQIDPAKIPNIEVRAKNINLNGIPFETLSIDIESVSTGITMNDIAIKGQNYNAKGNGSWRKTDNEEITSLVLELKGTNLSGALTELGYAEQGIRADRFKTDIDLSWTNTPFNLERSSLSGLLNIEVENGRLEKIDNGAVGRIFGLFAISALPKRLLLDFRDLFGRGLQFSLISGEFNIKDGLAYTDNLAIATSVADVLIEGETNLYKQEYDQIMTVVPRVSSTLPFVPFWIIQQLVDDNVVDRLFSQSYKIEGSWSDPIIEPVIEGLSSAGTDNEQSRIPRIEGGE